MSKENNLSKPKSIWNKNIKFDAKPLFSSLTKALIHLTTLNAEELGNDIIDAGASLGLEKSPNDLAFNLISVSLLNALLELTRESLSHLTTREAQRLDLSDNILRGLEGVSVNINNNFFKSPGSAEFIESIKKIYEEWLIDVGSTKDDAKSIAQRLPTYFTYAISEEWTNNNIQYAPLLEAANSPFSSAEDTENGWRLYFSHLRKRVNESIFDEPFGLSQIYVPLNAYYNKIEKTDPLSTKSDEPHKRTCTSLSSELKSWLKASDKSDAIRILSGGPGSGKSSFTKIFCCEVAEENIAKPIYIPLHLIDPTKEVTAEIERFVRDEGLLGFNPLEAPRNAKNTLIIFDGLDELASMGKAATQVARDFIQAVDRMIERRNLGQNPIFVILSGRELIVQENETEFRKHKQLLTILPYHLTDDEISDYDDPEELLKIDLRNVWWENYGKLTGKAYDGLPNELKLPEIDEITSQPLLNYLVALSYQRGKLNFNRSLNLNNVYADLVAAVHERAYEKSRTYRPISHINYKDFSRVLEEIGLAAWHGSDGRSTSVREITSHCKQSGLESLLKTFTEGAEAGVTKLLAAFFFRRNGESVGEDATFVFTHKSFGEYLTATRLVRGIERVVNERLRRKESHDEGYDIPEALIFWMKLAGPAPLTHYLRTFLQREISKKKDSELEEWQDILVELVSHAIENMTPADRIGGLTFQKSVQYDINTSTSLFIILNACSYALGKAAKLELKTDTSLGGFLKRVCPQRNSPQSPLIYSALSYIDISGQCLDMGDLYGADLSNSIWRNSNIHYANFARANLNNVDFSNSQLSYSLFETTRMNSVNFTGAKLREVSMENIKLINCQFNEAELPNSRFKNSNFTDCKFNSANIYKIEFNQRDSTFNNCDFSEAKVSAVEKTLIRNLRKYIDKGRITGEIEIVPENLIHTLI